ncbi:extracellular solute-binding protein [Neptunicoccus cionae]|nr:extracellular solute-binding protein [Amylibacter cionae]
MSRLICRTRRIVTIMAGLALIAPQLALAAPQHGLAMYGKPALPAGYESLPYTNPDAPQGGTVVLAEPGSFDSLNPYILKGQAPWGIRTHVVESLLGQSYDEPFTLYGLLAETVETDDARSWVEFTLRAEARFSNGDPVTPQDVIWSFETLGDKGHPRYLNSWDKVASSEITGPRSVKFTFNTPDRELPMILGLRPVLRKADWEDRPFEESGLQPITGTGPYVIDEFEAGRFVSFKRNRDYWGNDLGFNAGKHNLDEIKYDYYTDQSVIFEAFKAGALSVFREGNAQRWLQEYNFPAATTGEIVKSEIPHARPTGMTGFVMNTRREIFADIRVRDAMMHAFNFEFINQALNGGGLPRITSYFSNSQLSMKDGEADDAVHSLLAPFKDSLPTDALTGYHLPKSDGSGRNRRNLRKAAKLLEQAGWTVNNGVLVNNAGEPFTFEILLKNTATENEAIMGIFVDALKRLGIEARLKLIDPVQHRERLKDYDYDMVHFTRYMSLSPGNEQRLYWGRDGVNTPGTRNYMGMDSAAADAMIDTMLETRDAEVFNAAVRALDRVLTTGRYVIPIWYNPVSFLAHDAKLHYPERLPVYGDWTGFLPDVWWYQD